MTVNTIRGAQTGSVIYGTTETARANGLNVYHYVRTLLELLLSIKDGEDNIDKEKLEPFMPR